MLPNISPPGECAASDAIKLPLTVGCTGHRDIADPAQAALLAAEFLRTLANSHPHTPIRFLSGVAEGADRIAVLAFLEIQHERLQAQDHTAVQWEFVAVLPMEAAFYREDFPETVDEFDRLLALASKVIVVPSVPSNELAANPALRIDSYVGLGKHLVRHSNIILALWDGVQMEAAGGTSHVVRMKLNGIDAHDHGHRSALHDCGPVWHVPVKRSRATSAGPAHMGGWLSPDGTTLTREYFENSFREIELLNQGLTAEVSIEQAMKGVRYLSPSPEASGDLLSVLGMFDRQGVRLQAGVDKLAVLRDQKCRRLTMFAYCLALGVAFFLWSALDGVLQVTMTCGYILALGSVVMIYRILKSPKLAEAPLHYRFLAEALRVQLYWSLANNVGPAHGKKQSIMAAPSDAPNVLSGLLSQQAHEIGWVREALRGCALDPAGCSLVSQDLRAAHIRFWVLDQFDYFRKTEARYVTLGERLDKLAIGSVLLGAMAAVATLVHDLANHGDPFLRHFVAIAAAVFPACAVLLQSYRERLAVDEQAKSNLRMQWVFERARSHLVSRGPLAELPPAAVRSLGEEALMECANWLVLRKSKPPSMPT